MVNKNSTNKETKNKDTEHYSTLEKVFNNLNNLEQISNVLDWDKATMMPPSGADARIEQLSTLESIRNAIISDKSLKEVFIATEESKSNLSQIQLANFKAMKHIWKHNATIPIQLKRRLISEKLKCEIIWREAHAKNDFKLVAPYLKKVVKTTQEIAKIRSDVLKCKPYDALIDQYDPNMRSEKIDVLFDSLKSFLPGFIEEILKKQEAAPKLLSIENDFPIDKQKAVSIKFMKMMGFDFNQGRLDTSKHPFCGGYPSDVRITTTYNEKDLISSLMAVFHETGHALYEAGLPKKWSGQPIGNSSSMSLHESQSLLFEMQICRSKSFLKLLLPVIRKEFSLKGKAWNIDNVLGYHQKIQPSLIRIHADEVTYPLHVILRYNIEKHLIQGDIEVEDLPDTWAKGMKALLNITPKTDSDGCMQDIHWYDGNFGYFPCYLLGAIYSAQIFDTIKEQNAGIFDSIEKGDFSSVVSWLNENIHKHGSRDSAEKIVSKATNKEINIEIYKKHLHSRYLTN